LQRQSACSSVAQPSASPSQDDDHNNAADGRCRCHFRHAERERTDHVLWRLLGETARRPACVATKLACATHSPSEAVGDGEFFEERVVGTTVHNDMTHVASHAVNARCSDANQTHLDRSHRTLHEACRTETKKRTGVCRRHLLTPALFSRARSACSHAATDACRMRHLLPHCLG
jgi:hypothetical protein